MDCISSAIELFVVVVASLLHGPLRVERQEKKNFTRVINYNFWPFWTLSVFGQREYNLLGEMHRISKEEIFQLSLPLWQSSQSFDKK
jgi:hypothetical protein